MGRYARLACYERMAWTTGKSAQCLRLDSDVARMTCFDRPDAAAPVASAAKPPAPPPSVPTPRFRIEVGIGYGFAHYDGTLMRMSERLTVDSMIGVRGTAIHVGIWDDRLIAKSVSIGMEYLKLDLNARFSGAADYGIGNF
ncbi:hypothetical protein, partial [Magnetospirillum fulvum]